MPRLMFLVTGLLVGELSLIIFLLNIFLTNIYFIKFIHLILHPNKVSPPFSYNCRVRSVFSILLSDFQNITQTANAFSLWNLSHLEGPSVQHLEQSRWRCWQVALMLNPKGSWDPCHGWGKQPNSLSSVVSALPGLLWLWVVFHVCADPRPGGHPEWLAEAFERSSLRSP